MIRLTTSTGALRAWVNVALGLLAVGLLAFFTIAYVAGQQRKICGLIVIMDDAYHSTPPATETGRRLADEVARYRAEIGC